MSKRLGRFIPLDTLVDEVGADAVRYFYLLRSPEAMLEFDLDLMLAQSNENPVYYAQYAHARLANLEEFARENAGSLPAEPDLTRLEQPWELDLAREVAFWPEHVEDAARLLPTASGYQLTDCFTDVEVAEGAVGATVTVQGFARENLEAPALLAVAAALVALRDALGADGAKARIDLVEVVQSVEG